MNTSYIGVDISKAKFHCAWLRDAQTLKVKTKVFDNQSTGFTALHAWLQKTVKQTPEQIIVVMEATGVYYEPLAYALHDYGYQVCVVNPARAKQFTRSISNGSKTDKQDSVMLARFGATQPLEPWAPEAPEIRHLKALLKRLDTLERDKQRENNRLEKANFSNTAEFVKRSILDMIEVYDSQIAAVKQEIDDHIDKHPSLKRDVNYLKSIPGIGDVIAPRMMVTLRGRDFKNAGQCAAFLGLVPVLQESGIFKGRTRLSKQGDSVMRAKLYMAAIVAIQYNQDIKRQYERLLDRGKTKMQALGAAMRKLVHICFGVLKNQCVYQPQIVIN